MTDVTTVAATITGATTGARNGATVITTFEAVATAGAQSAANFKASPTSPILIGDEKQGEEGSFVYIAMKMKLLPSLGTAVYIVNSWKLLKVNNSTDLIN